MKKIKTHIEDLVLIEPNVLEDSRGYFFESFNKQKFHDLGITADFLQDNQSLSQKGVLRGLHFQSPPYSQAKLVRAIHGSILDVAVDIRKDSKTYGEYSSHILSAQNKKMFYIPDGFAHGFLTLENNTIVQYKCSALYNKDAEGGIAWNDPTINIQWGTRDAPVISHKDTIHPSLEDLQAPF
jgi:dTDP-4-dehydrorhamnose 3,5-epimerase